jgi:hypothetical protein
MDGIPKTLAFKMLFWRLPMQTLHKELREETSN